MRIFDAFEIAWNDFTANKMRTFLTILGVSIGIGAIVFLVSLGYGVQELTINKITSITALTTYEINTEGSSIIKINDDLLAKIKTINGVTGVYPNFSASAQLGKNDLWTDTTVYAVDRQYLEYEGVKLEKGEYWNEKSERVLLTTAALTALGIDANSALNQKIDLNLLVSQSKTAGESSEPIELQLPIGGIISDNATSYAYIPLSQIPLQNKDYYSAKVKVSSQASMASVKDELTSLGVKTTTVGDTVVQLEKIFNIVRIVLFMLGLVALFVASIGMFNTLTISLLEKTREIGIIKALGATNSFVWQVFNFQAILISTLGGIFGILIGWGFGKILNVLVNIIAKSLGGESVNLFVTPMQFIISIIAVSFIIGILTGYYPSRRASKINPLDALRYE